MIDYDEMASHASATGLKPSWTATLLKAATVTEMSRERSSAMMPFQGALSFEFGEFMRCNIFV